MKRIGIFLTVFVLLFVSCAGTYSERRAPFWYYNPQKRAKSSEIAFTGEGRADTERQAMLFAFSDLNNRIHSYLGIESSDETYAELITKETIKAYGLSVAEKYQVKEQNGYTVYLLAVANAELLRNARSDDMLKESELALQAEKLILEGDELIKSNQDISGLKKYLQSMILTYPLSQIENEYSFSVILDEVLYILETTDISVSEESPSEAGCTVRVRRTETLIPSDVKSGPIRASYSARSIADSGYSDSFVFSTGKNGAFRFSPKNNLIEKTGTVVFVPDIADEIGKISLLSKSAGERLTEALYACKAEFDYSIEYKTGTLGFCTFEMTGDGVYRNSERLNVLLKNRFDSDGAGYLGLNIAESSVGDDLFIRRIGSFYPDVEYMVVTRVTYVDSVKSRNSVCVCTVRGNIKIYRVSDGKIVFDSKPIYSNGFGQNSEEAENDAYAGFVSTAYPMIKAHYV